MNLGDLLTRFHHIIGDTAERLVSDADVIAWMNDGANVTRGLCGEIWGRQLIATQAGVGRYSIPSDAHRLVRIAYGWQTLFECSRAELDAMDLGWTTRPGLPEYFTQDTELFDKFVVYRIPESNSSDVMDMTNDASVSSPDFGIVGDVIIGGVHVSFGGNNFGEIGSASFATVAPNFGVVGSFDAVPSDMLVAWYVKKCVPMTEASSPVPIRRPFARMPLWFALWKYYGAESDWHNGILSGLYREFFYTDVAKLMKIVARPLPRQRHVMGAGPDRTRTRERHPYSDTMTPPSGPPIRLIW